jgi:hypothetical protein
VGLALRSVRTEAPPKALSAVAAGFARDTVCWPISLSNPDRVDLQSAKEHYESAVELADRLRIRPLPARSHLGLGLLYQRAGRATIAAETLRRAAAMSSEMGMSYLKNLAEDAPKLLTVGT